MTYINTARQDDDDMSGSKNYAIDTDIFEAVNHTLALQQGPQSLVLIKQIKAGVSAEVLERVLAAHGVDVQLYGVGLAKSLAQLANEIVLGDCAIVLLSDSTLLRFVQPIFIVLRFQNFVLVNIKDVYVNRKDKNGDPLVKQKNSLLSEKVQNIDNNVMEAACRGIKEELGIPLDYVRRCLCEEYSESIKSFTKQSPSYPGLSTNYLQYLVTLRLSEDYEDLLKLFNCFLCHNPGEPIENKPFTSQETSQSGLVIHHWIWMNEEVAIDEKVYGLV